MSAGMEILKASKPGTGKKLKWSGKTLTSEILRAEIDTRDFARRGSARRTRSWPAAIRPAIRTNAGSARFAPNSLIILDIFPRDAKTGYWGDMTRTVVRGRASEQQRKLWETVKAGQALALKQIKAGVDGLSIHQAINELFERRGFPTEVRNGRRVGFFHGTGHGLGLEIHEYPRLQKVVLKAGQVSHGRAGFVLSGTRRRADRRCGDCGKNRL